MPRVLAALVIAVTILALTSRPDSAPISDPAAGRTEVVVALESPPLARAPGTSARLEAEQRAFRRALERHLPKASLGWRYRLVLNGYAVELPERSLARLRSLPGVRDVYSGGDYGPTLTRSPGRIGAPALWGPGLASAGQGTKVGIIDSGIDPEHVFFDPSGYTMPAGFPKGQLRYTTAKVIVARAFPPRGAQAASARLAFHPDDSSHGTHVAGIAAGNDGTQAQGGRVVSGVAPRAYLGNYKVFVETGEGLSPNANAPAIVAAIEAAVADGMDVINFSGGEPEIEPSRDVVALALDAAAAAGVIPVVAAGNDYGAAGAGSVSSPANSASAIAVGAVSTGASSDDSHAEFSSVGPTPISLRLKPDVAAPGVSILSSVPGGWSSLSGTSMASPHVAGAAALLRQRHPDWSVAQVKAALVATGRPGIEADGVVLAGPPFVGGGLVSLREADTPFLFTSPSAVSFGLLEGRGFAVAGVVELRDAGSGAGTWEASVEHSRAPQGAAVALGASQVLVPGELAYEVRVDDSAREGELTGYLTLRRGSDVRRIPFWGRVSASALGRHRLVPLARPGVRRGTTLGRPALVARYRYPENPGGLDVTTVLRGPEAVYRISISKRVANFGVVVTSRERGSRVEPRVVSGQDENRLTGYAGLPVAHNPYLESFREPVLAAAALSPRRGTYAVVFDSATRSGAGRFTFRFWVNDVTPPTLRVRSRTVAVGTPILVAATDAGSGVYPGEIVAAIDARSVDAAYRAGVVRIRTNGIPVGRHRLRLRVSDYQETKNTENVARILPNTRTLSTTVTIRRP